jgi:hypothetical protein
VAAVSPSRSMAILSRMLSLRSWILAKRLAVHLVGPLSLAILDPEVVADRQQPLAHHEALAVRPVVPPQKTHVPTLTRTASHRIPRIG